MQRRKFIQTTGVTLIAPIAILDKCTSSNTTDIVLPSTVVLNPGLGASIALPVMGASMLVSSILNDFKKMALELLDEAEKKANALIAKIANEILIATQNLFYFLDKSIDKIFNELEISQQNLFYRLNDSIAISLNNAFEKAENLEEKVFLDLIEISDSVNPFQNTRFKITSVKGNTIIETGRNSMISLTGIGFDIDNDKNQYQYDIKVGGVTLDKKTFIKSGNRNLKFEIPFSVTKDYFKDFEIVYIPVDLSVMIVSKSWGFFNKTEIFTSTFNLVLLPKKAAKIRIQQIIKETVVDGTKLEVPIRASYREGQCPGDRPCYYEYTHRCAQNEIITNVLYDCVATGQCGWSIGRKGQYEADFKIADDRKSATVYRFFNGEDVGVDFTHTFIMQKLVEKDRRIESGEIEINYNQVLPFELHPSNHNRNYLVIGNFYNGAGYSSNVKNSSQLDISPAEGSIIIQAKKPL